MNERKWLWTILMLVSLVSLLSGCSSASSRIVIKYHHSNSEGTSYWMTLLYHNSETDREHASLFFCNAEEEEKPVCYPAVLKPCAEKGRCDLDSESVVDTELASSVRAREGKTEKPSGIGLGL